MFLPTTAGRPGNRVGTSTLLLLLAPLLLTLPAPSGGVSAEGDRSGGAASASGTPPQTHVDGGTQSPAHTATATVHGWQLNSGKHHGPTRERERVARASLSTTGHPTSVDALVQAGARRMTDASRLEACMSGNLAGSFGADWSVDSPADLVE